MHDAYLTERRRPFSSSDKLRIVLEAESAGVSYAHVARHNGISISCLNDWRRQKRLGQLVDDGPAFVPVQVIDDIPTAEERSADRLRDDGWADGRIEIDLGDHRCIRVDRHVDAMALRRVLDVLATVR